MKLMDMNLKGDEAGPMVSADAYDCSPMVFLSESQCAALGFATPPAAGSTLRIEGMAIVTSVTQSADDDEDDPDIRMSIRITQLGCSTDDATTAAQKSAADRMYGPGA